MDFFPAAETILLYLTVGFIFFDVLFISLYILFMDFVNATLTWLRLSTGFWIPQTTSYCWLDSALISNPLGTSLYLSVSSFLVLYWYPDNGICLHYLWTDMSDIAVFLPWWPYISVHLGTRLHISLFILIYKPCDIFIGVYHFPILLQLFKVFYVTHVCLLPKIERVFLSDCTTSITPCFISSCWCEMFLMIYSSFMTCMFASDPGQSSIEHSFTPYQVCNVLGKYWTFYSCYTPRLFSLL